MEDWFTPLFGFLGVLIGGYIAHVSLGRLQRAYLKTELKIRKYSDALADTLELTRAIAKNQSQIVSMLRKEISSGEFRIENKEMQNEVMSIKRKLINSSPFLLDDTNQKIEKYHKYYNDVICMKIYDIYVDPNDSNVQYYKESEHRYFEEDFMYCLLGFHEVIDELQKEIKLLYHQL